MKKLVILQSNYIPWKGYFDILHDADMFLFYDEVQFTTRDWRNRNKVYSKQGLSKWLTVPCGNDRDRRIDEVKINNDLPWNQDHWNAISNAYAKAPHFHEYKDFFQHVYFEMKWEYLSHLNQFLIKHISKEFLGVKTEFASSTEYDSTGKSSDKILSLCKSVGCEEYISGPAAKSYMDEAAFSAEGINVAWKDYSGYPEYSQAREPFENAVSIVDLLMNTGKDAPYYIWGWREVLK